MKEVEIIDSDKIDKTIEVSWTEHFLQNESSGCSIVPVTF